MARTSVQFLQQWSNQRKLCLCNGTTNLIRTKFPETLFDSFICKNFSLLFRETTPPGSADLMKLSICNFPRLARSWRLPRDALGRVSLREAGVIQVSEESRRPICVRMQSPRVRGSCKLPPPVSRHRIQQLLRSRTRVLLLLFDEDTQPEINPSKIPWICA